VQRKAGEAHERQPVAQLVPGLVVRQRVERLQHQDAELQKLALNLTDGVVKLR
jgi:hypothetical protein